MLIPVLTEKSLKETKNGGFTFWVSRDLTKIQIKKLIEMTFGVNVVGVKIVNLKARTKKNMRGKVQTIKASKKATVFLKDGEKIDLFEEEKKPKKTKKETKK